MEEQYFLRLESEKAGIVARVNLLSPGSFVEGYQSIRKHRDSKQISEIEAIGMFRTLGEYMFEENARTFCALERDIKKAA